MAMTNERQDDTTLDPGQRDQLASGRDRDGNLERPRPDGPVHPDPANPQIPAGVVPPGGPVPGTGELNTRPDRQRGIPAEDRAEAEAVRDGSVRDDIDR